MLTKKKWNEIEVDWWVEEATWGPPSTLRGWGNGYAVVPINNPMHGVESFYENGFTLDVNSEVTFAGMRPYGGKEYWVIGFDTAHYGDDISRWPKEEVEKEAMNFAEQIKKYNNVK